ncbi:bifunctional homocysteine S-methyltransferase/methylenetetrahydrofolate reductase [bacterium]
MKLSFQEYIKNNLVLFDGAIGTYIYQKGIFIDKCYDALNLSNPALVQGIHEEYLKAGADVIETNTFGANRYKLKKHNLTGQVRDINLRGAEIAREAGTAHFIAGSIGPLGVKIVPWGSITLPDAREAFKEQASALCEGNVDLIILETFQNLNELEQAILAIREISDIPIVAQMAFQEDVQTIFGTGLEEMASRLNQLPVDALGLNCMLGPKLLLDDLEQLVQFTEKPISIMPNAGYPQLVDGRMFYMSTPEYMGVYSMRFIQAGVRILGGCCGTTPDHIRKMAEAIAQKQTRLKHHIQTYTSKPKDVNLPEPIPFAEKSQLASKLSKKSYVTLVEMVPPKGRDLSKQITGAKKLKEFGIDAINIPDGPRASARMNCTAMAITLQNEVHIETVLHYSCRDRNLLGIQSDLLGASVLGINNILAITGDPPKMGDYPEATAVFDIDSIGLTRFISNLNSGMDIGCKPIGQPTSFLIGIGVDPNSVNIDLERKRFIEKYEAGAEYAITQPVFDITALESFLESLSELTLPIIAGIWPLVSLRNAEFMKNEVPGVMVPNKLIDRIAEYSNKEDQMKVGVEIAQEMAVQVKSFTQGIQVSAPFGRVEIAMDVLTSVMDK